MGPVTLTVFQITPDRRLAALRAFGLLRATGKVTPGLRFGKAMGCGRGAVFSILPDWGRYVFMGVWNRPDDYRAWLDSKAARRLIDAAATVRTFHLSCFKAKGKWDDAQPFEVARQAAGPGPIAVLTRADIHPFRLRSFWKHSYATAAVLEGHSGLRFSIGMGEWPFFRQATFSVWESADAMKAFAYADPAHRAAMQAKVAKGIFTEELFARFSVLGDEMTSPGDRQG